MKRRAGSQFRLMADQPHHLPSNITAVCLLAHESHLSAQPQASIHSARRASRGRRHSQPPASHSTAHSAQQQPGTRQAPRRAAIHQEPGGRHTATHRQAQSAPRRIRATAKALRATYGCLCQADNDQLPVGTAAKDPRSLQAAAAAASFAVVAAAKAAGRNIVAAGEDAAGLLA
eukprot:COSAG01_NODE_19_length_39011_cov_38.134968_39_plen_174_part_00